MDIDNLTIGQARALASMFGTTPAAVQPTEAPGGTERAVLVTTEHRGVFFGYTTDAAGETIKLRAARMCIYWSSKTGGVVGLASDGPVDAVASGAGSRIGASADVVLRKITAVFSVTDAAAAVWVAAPVYRDR